MSLKTSTVLFALPAIAIFISYHFFMPLLINWGLTPYESFVVSHIVPMALLFAAAFAAFQREGNPPTVSAFRDRYRFTSITVKDVIWGVLIFIILMTVTGPFLIITGVLIEANLIPLPSSIPILSDPRLDLTQIISLPIFEEFLGNPIKGNWSLILLSSLLLFFNVVGEELWWRGYILPRQELAHGDKTWIIHGVMWTLFHFFIWWDLLGLVPVCLIIAYSAQRQQKNWSVLIAHFLYNGLVIFIFLGAVI